MSNAVLYSAELGEPTTGLGGPSPVHEIWSELRGQLKGALATELDKFALQIEEHRLSRLKDTGAVLWTIGAATGATGIDVAFFVRAYRTSETCQADKSRLARHTLCQEASGYICRLALDNDGEPLHLIIALSSNQLALSEFLAFDWASNSSVMRVPDDLLWSAFERHSGRQRDQLCRL